MIKEEIIKKLRGAFNLNIYEAKVWVALLSKGVATAGELSEMTQVPRSRSYDVLESLEKKGFIIMKIGRPIKYIAVEPGEIIRRVKKTIKEKSDKDVDFIEKIKGTDTFEELALLHKQGIEHIDPINITGSFSGRGNIYEQLISMISNAQKEVIIATTDSGFLRKAEALKPVLKKAKSHKVDIKIVAPLTTNEHKEVAKDLSEIVKVKDFAMASRFVIVDNKEMLMFLTDDSKTHESAEVGIWVNTPFFANSLSNMFNNLWNSKK